MSTLILRKLSDCGVINWWWYWRDGLSQFFQHLPQTIQLIVTNSVVVTSILAVVLNMILNGKINDDGEQVMDGKIVEKGLAQ